MTINAISEPGREERLNEVLLWYVEAAQAGQAVNRRQLLAENPDLRLELEEFFASHDTVERLARPLRRVSREGNGSSVSSGRRVADQPSDQAAWPGLESSEAAAVPDLGFAGSAPATETGGLGELGDFRLVREVGRGGMGVVYEAEQISLRRRVALKVLPFAAALDRRQLQRFQNEALAAAHLRHEHIIPVFAVGSDRGVHYYAMQFVEGQSLADVIEDLRRLEDDERDRSNTVRKPSGSKERSGPSAYPAAETRSSGLVLTVSETISRERSAGDGRYSRWVAGLGRQAALALEHAHQAGIVHRDIKPANLLLDDRGELWITDFGLARFNSDVGLTRSGELLGTLRYASPEQALARRGLVDHRSDIYSLGATLYELLALRPIFDGQDRNDLLRQITVDEPAPLRGARKAIPEELETIILKALAKEPGDRYATAQDFADDLACFLEDRPIQARRPSLVEKATKWARRHRAVVGSAVAALVISVAGLTVSTVLAARAYERERGKAKEADQQRTRAEDNFRLARQAVDRFAQIGEKEMAGRPELEPVRQRLLEVALAYYQDFLALRRDDRLAHDELEVSRAKAGTILGELATLMGAARYFPLHWRTVQDELGLSPEQRAALDRLRDRWRTAFNDSFGQDPDEWERRRLALAREQEPEVTRVLTADQLQRFHQIALQLAGLRAFADPTVVEALHLTSEQKERIRTYQEKFRLGGPMFPPRGGPGRSREGRDDSRWRDVRERMDKARDEVLSLLTPEQRAKWGSLIGQPFVRTPGPPSPDALPPH
jgi:serine/threonine protein kinase